MKNKGKQRFYLYLIRKQNKILRRIRRKKKSRENSRPYIGVDDKYRPDLDEANKILKTLDKKKFGIAFPIRKDYKGRVFVSIPSNFSISDYPEDVIKFLRRFYATLRDYSVKEIYLNYSECSELGFSASVTMDAIALL